MYQTEMPWIQRICSCAVLEPCPETGTALQLRTLRVANELEPWTVRQEAISQSGLQGVGAADFRELAQGFTPLGNFFTDPAPHFFGNGPECLDHSGIELVS